MGCDVTQCFLTTMVRLPMGLSISIRGAATMMWFFSMWYSGSGFLAQVKVVVLQSWMDSRMGFSRASPLRSLYRASPFMASIFWVSVIITAAQEVEL